MVTFLEWVLESSLLVWMVLGIRKIFMGKVHYAAIYSLWIVVLLRFMIPVNFISTPVSVANLFEKSLSAWDHTEADAQRDPSNGDRKVTENGVVLTGLHSWQSTGKVFDSQGFSDSNSFGTEEDGSGRVLSGMGKGGSVFTVLSAIHWYPVWKYGKLVIAVLLLLWFAASNASLLRRMRVDRRLYGQRGKLKIYTVSHLQTPCLYGFVEPAIYLPEALLAPGSGRIVSAEELEQIITHEYVHYQHRDHIWAMLRMLVVSIHWYNPFVWIAASCSKKDAELFCDETVIRMLGEENRFRYGRMLVRLAGNGRWGDFRYSMMLMSRRGREMEGRIRAIGGKRRYSKWMFLPLGVALMAAVAVTFSSGIGTSAAQEDAAEVEESVQRDRSQIDASEGMASVHRDRSQIQNPTETEQQKLSYADNYEEAFDRYIQGFTDAVNTGNIQDLDQVLLEGSDVYQQQCAIVQNYHKRGIREEIMDYSISSANKRTADLVSIDSDEEILVYYSDNTSKVVRQKYRYTCEYIGQGWIITGMQGIR